jgi:predicted alpha/beta-fold hydrolase
MKILTKKSATFAVLALLILLILSSVVIGWMASSQLTAINHDTIAYDQTVTSVKDDILTTSGNAYNIDGVVGAIRQDGSIIGILGAPTNLNKSAKTSSRSLAIISGNAPAVGDKISLQGNIWTTDPQAALGLDYQNVTYDSPLGAMKAWLIKGDTSKPWVIGVHGLSGDKTEMLRFISPVHTSGNTMMVINYRNDVANPQSPDGRNNLGDTEWQDIQAAVSYAQKQGATSIQLYGDSLGGSIVENYLRRGNNTQQVSKVILDSPALSWKQIVTDRLKDNHLPSFFYYPTALMVKARTGISLNKISTQPDDIKHKTLIIHTADDPNVPQQASKDLAAKRPDLVTLVDFGGGGHLRSWNYNQRGYEQAISNFLQQ